MLAGGVQGQAGQGAHLELELRDIAGVQCVVAAVVWAGGHFVDDQAAVLEHKKFNAQHPDIVQAFCDGSGGRNRAVAKGRWQVARMGRGDGQDAVSVHIGLRRVMHHDAVPATRHHHRQLGLQVQQLLQHAGYTLQSGPGVCQFIARAYPKLAAPVVTEPGCLQNAGQQGIRHGSQVGLALQHGIGCAGHAAAHKMGFFLDSVLSNGHRLCARGYRPVRAQRVQGRRRHVLKLGGDGSTALHQLRQTLLIEVIGMNMVVTHQARRADHIGVEHRGEITHALRGLHKHAAQLAPAHHPQRGLLAFARARQNRGRAHGAGGSVTLPASRVCSAR